MARSVKRFLSMANTTNHGLNMNTMTVVDQASRSPYSAHKNFKVLENFFNVRLERVQPMP